MEIYFDSEWGTVCNHNWGQRNADVVCRQIGFPDAIQAEAFYGQGSGRIWLDNVSCNGSEVQLSDCSHNGWDIVDCHHNDDIGIICGGILNYLISLHTYMHTYEWIPLQRHTYTI